MSHQELVAAAEAAREHAYAPYSGFLVGAAVVDDQGRIFAGANVENASYGLAMCAERTAIALAVSAGARRLKELVVVTSVHPPSAPCGACRQVMLEFGPDMKVTAVGPDGQRTWAMVNLLPDAFGSEDLNTGIK